MKQKLIHIMSLRPGHVLADAESLHNGDPRIVRVVHEFMPNARRKYEVWFADGSVTETEIGEHIVRLAS